MLFAVYIFDNAFLLGFFAFESEKSRRIGKSHPECLRLHCLRTSYCVNVILIGKTSDRHDSINSLRYSKNCNITMSNSLPRTRRPRYIHTSCATLYKPDNERLGTRQE